MVNAHGYKVARVTGKRRRNFGRDDADGYGLRRPTRVRFVVSPSSRKGLENAGGHTHGHNVFTASC